MFPGTLLWAIPLAALLLGEAPPRGAAEDVRIARWIKDLEDRDFQVRQQATVELTRIGGAYPYRAPAQAVVVEAQAVA